MKTKKRSVHAVREHFSTTEQRSNRAKGPFPDGHYLTPGSSVHPAKRIDLPVPEIQQNISSHHKPVQDVQTDHGIGAEKYLVQDAGNIPQKNHPQKKKALSGIGPGPVGPVQGKGPGRPKTDQHGNFKNAHISPNRFLKE
jgi:hypothetical protein